MKQHPEQQEGEIYMGNSDPSGFAASFWRTKRQGVAALDVNISPINYAYEHRLRPWFIKADEVRETVRVADEWEAGIISPMLEESWNPYGGAI